MTEKIKTSWWRNVPSSEPGNEPNVVPMRKQSLDDLERELIEAQNAVVDKGAGADRAALAYNSAVDNLKRVRARMAERMKEHGARLEYVMHFPEINMHGGDDDDTAG